MKGHTKIHNERFQEIIIDICIKKASNSEPAF
jgi:hypothetical protein